MAAIRKDFLRNLPKVQPDLFDDMKRSVDTLFGVDTDEWREVCVWKAMEHIILSSTNRLFFGPPLCENEEYIRFSGWFAFWLGFGGVVVGSLIPSIIRPIVGYLAAIPVYINRNRSLKFLIPVIAKRMDDLKAYRDGRAPDYIKPDNLITWIIEKLLDANDTSSPPALIAEQLLFFVCSSPDTQLRY